MRGCWVTLVLVLICTLGWAAQLQAETSENPFFKECAFYPSSKAFVKTVSYYCVRQRDSRRCHEAARTYFQVCRYDGDFQQMSREAYTGMLFMFVVAKAPQVADTVPQR